MSVEKLISEHMDVWAGAVTHKVAAGRDGGKRELTGVRRLRELVLDLAVRGQLVQQETDDEPASALLVRIEAEQRELVARREIRKPKATAKIEADEIPFSLPSSWVWCRLSAIGRDWGQKEPDQRFTYIDVSAIDNQSGLVSNPSVVEPEQAPSRARKLVRSGTLVYSTVRPYLKNIAVVEATYDPEPIASTAFAIVHPLGGMPARFFLHYLRSPTFVRYVESVQSGIAYPAVNDKQFFSGLVPLPPLAEQHRIVKKVDELMALCDRLEQQTGDQIEAHKRLVDTLLETLTRAKNATELAENWARVEEHFDTLFTTEHSIDRLKQTVLQLAVMGRLADQERNDESANSLLNRTEAARSELIRRARKSKGGKVEVEGCSPCLPRGWASLRVSELFDLQNGYAFKSSWFQKDGVRLVRNLNIRHGTVDWSDAAFVSRERAEELYRFSLELGDVVISLDRPLISTGLKYAVIKHEDLPCLLLQRVARFKDVGGRRVSGDLVEFQ